MYNILIIGHGAREHAVAKSLRKSIIPFKLYGIGQSINVGLNTLCDEYVIMDVNNNSQILYYCNEKHIDIAILGPEQLLKNKLVAVLDDICFCIGPSFSLSKLETSKYFARKFINSNTTIRNYNPSFIGMDIYNDELIEDFCTKYDNEIVVKADGLHGGKGVKVFNKDLFSLDDIKDYCKEIINNNEVVVLEEKCVGKEFSFISILHDSHAEHTFPIMDFKRLNECDTGPNTGSMGALTDNNSLSFLTQQDIETVKIINKSIINQLELYYKTTYTGFLYGSYMKTEDGIKIIEFNCRLGDPEAIVLFENLKTSLFDIILSMKENRFANMVIEYKIQSVICKYIVPLIYPNNKLNPSYFAYNCEISSMLDLTELSNIQKDSLYYGSFDGEKMLGSRAIAICYTTNYPLMKLHEQSINNSILNGIKGDFHYRTDLIQSYQNKLIKNERKSLNYKDCGVDIDNVTDTLSICKEIVQSTYNKNVCSDLGTFGGMYSIKDYMTSMKEPILVSSTDGVGTKSEFLCKYLDHSEAFYRLGQDLVNHCINDILVQGAKPLFFLDYFASSHIKSDNLIQFIKGVSYSCKKYDCVLIGGETAEMPGIYNKNAHDFVGTIVGILDKKELIDGKQMIEKDDVVITLPSSGPHTNGYSMLNKLYAYTDKEQLHPDLLNVHRCYIDEINLLRENNISIHGLCHITGGGLKDNPPRVLPDNLTIEYNSFTIPTSFKNIQNNGNLTDEELYKVFNCGIGMFIFVNKHDVSNTLKLLKDSYIIGKTI
uniref:phosphoribosylformylglycinamidine cyclo-ligase n=1 Tax=viral metagenome TaxID=1070528 RepID=A0A6C0KEH8_9ZZZZ